jgi:hypothetical protein
VALSRRTASVGRHRLSVVRAALPRYCPRSASACGPTAAARPRPGLPPRPPAPPR